MVKENPFDIASVRSMYFSILTAIKNTLKQSQKPLEFPIIHNLPKSNLFESAKVIIKDEWGNAEIHIKPIVAVKEINVQMGFAPKERPSNPNIQVSSNKPIKIELDNGFLFINDHGVPDTPYERQRILDILKQASNWLNINVLLNGVRYDGVMSIVNGNLQVSTSQGIYTLWKGSNVNCKS